MFSLTITVDDNDITPVYRHVHHAQALRYLEEARLRYLESIGYPTEWFQERSLFLVITRIEIAYLKEIFAEPLLVTCEDVRCVRRAVVMTQRIVKASDDRPAVEATVTSMLLDGSTKRSATFPDEFFQAVRGRGC